MDPSFLVAQHLLDSAAAALDALPQRAPQHQLLAEGGLVAHDNCCDGQLWVAWSGSRVSLSLDAIDENQRARCGHGVAATYRVGVLRCAAELTDEGFPTAADMAASAEIRSSDAWAVLNAVSCALSEDQLDNLTVTAGTGDQFIDAILFGQDPLGPEGGCVGSEITARVLIIPAAVA